jgi:hypothetical protein
MLLTRSEFQKEFRFNTASSVSKLITGGKITVNEDGYIDTNAKENKQWVAKRRAELRKQKKDAKAAAQGKTQTQLNLELDILNAKLDEKKRRTELLDLKVQKEKKEVIETDILNRVLIMIFDDFFKNLAEFPNNYASEIINIVRANKEPKEKLIEFLTEHIITNIKTGLDNTRKAAKKYYE